MKRLLLIALGCAAFLAGCTESTILDPTGPAVPETEIIEGIQIDWSQVQDELDEEFVESDDYPYGKNIDFYVEDGNAYMMVTVEDGVSKEEAAEYATAIYKAHARPIDQIPHDRVNKGTGHRYQSQVYTCRKDEAGRKLDKAAMLLCSKALGHNRLEVVANNYIRDL